MIARAGAELILHGHNHTTTSALVPGPDGRFVPVIGAPSASARPDGHGGLAARRASYLLYEITRNGAGYAVTARRRGLDAGGTVCDLGPIALD